MAIQKVISGWFAWVLANFRVRSRLHGKFNAKSSSRIRRRNYAFFHFCTLSFAKYSCEDNSYYYVIRFLPFSFVWQLAGWSDPSPKKSVLIDSSHAWDSMTFEFCFSDEPSPFQTSIPVFRIKKYVWLWYEITESQDLAGKCSILFLQKQVVESHACVEPIHTLFLGLESLHPASCYAKENVKIRIT